ncbi:hypothetical protein OG195_12555 [Streptomyces sp. NBC_01362]|uniref:hypothetical protein n=1 Tax=Streptomyces sp. NBC_01362 TaxID=2903839 RepID=UPI002E36BF6D|nr:hypothetical protein [Streptomyces sp. NBC_01362]
MQLFFTDYRAVWRAGEVAGMSRSDLEDLFERRPLPAGTPILLDDQMRPIEPITSWGRDLALDDFDPDTMREYGYAAIRLLGYLVARGLDLESASETDIKGYRQWRTGTSRRPVQKSTWEKEAAALTSLSRFLNRSGESTAGGWRLSKVTGRRVSRDMRVRHMELDQYLFFRDVGFGGLEPSGSVDVAFDGWRPHRNRAACELGLLTGMRIQEWSTLLLPELGLLGGRRPRRTEVDLAACAKRQYPRTVYVPMDAMELLDPYLLLERPRMVAAAQRTLRRRCGDLFVVDRVEADGRRVSGVFEGHRVTWVVKMMDPGLRRLAVLETGDGLDPLAVFLGRGGSMLTPSGWDRARWRAWDRMKAAAAGQPDGLLPGQCWVYHDLRHSFALRLLIFLTREALNDIEAQELPMSTLLDHMTGNPLLVVQQRLGHESPSSTYKYIRYLKDPMADVDAAFREWTAAGGASYADIARELMSLGGSGASQG